MRKSAVAILFALILLESGRAQNQTPASPRLVRFSGKLSGDNGQPRTGSIGVTLSLYDAQEGGAALWSETQNVLLDDQGSFTVLLGATRAAGLPLDLFVSGAARWLGVRPVAIGALEQKRVMLVGVPYAMKAGDTDMLGGLPATAYALADPAAAGAVNFTRAGSMTMADTTATPKPVTTTGGTANAIPKFSSATAVVDSAIVDNNGKVAITGTLSLNGDSPLASSPRVFVSAFLAGDLVTPVSAGRMIPERAITVTRVTVNLKTAGANCTEPAVISVTDGATKEQEIFLGSGTSAYDSGPMSMPFAAGANVDVLLSRGAVCLSGTNPANADVAIQYRMGAPGDATLCPTGTVSCFGICTTVGGDALNCGTCGNICAAGNVCSGGTCQALTCPTGQTVCGLGCATTSSDNNNCGACGNRCGAGTACVSGACQAACPAGQVSCNGVCTNTSNSNANCGTCGNVCPSGQICSAGMCSLSCQAGLTNCGGMCTNTANSNSNCGTCGSTCPSGQICSAGMCSLSCQAGLTNCDGMCTNTLNSNTNCGACGNVCPSGQICSAGMCSLSCQPGLTNCGNTCTNLSFDPHNCGGCGFACPAGKACLNAMCQ
jgi:Stigma-specific protein, Stig1